MGDTRADDQSVGRVQVQMGTTAILALLVAIAAAALVVQLVAAAHRILGWIVATAVVAALLAPVVAVIARLVPRFLAAIATVLLLGAATVVVVVVVLGGLRHDADAIAGVIEDAAARVEERHDPVGRLARDIELGRVAQEVTTGVREDMIGDGTTLAEAAGTAPVYFVNGVLTVFMLLYGPRVADAALARLPPARASRWHDVSALALAKARRYVWASIAQAAVVGVVVAVLGAMFATTALTAFVVVAAVLGLLPYVGIVLGTAPLLLVALAGHPLWIVATAGVAAVALQVVEAVAVRRAVDRRSVHVGPTVPLVVGLVGFETAGLGGALYGAAVAVFLLALADAAAMDDPDPEEPGAPGDEEIPTPVDG